jgi:hypothetical protein
MIFQAFLVCAARLSPRADSIREIRVIPGQASSGGGEVAWQGFGCVYFVS